MVQSWRKMVVCALLAQCMVEEEIMVYRFAGITGKALTKTGSIKVKGGPAGIRTAE